MENRGFYPFDILEEQGFYWTRHAFREWGAWSVEHEDPDEKSLGSSADNTRKRTLPNALKRKK